MTPEELELLLTPEQLAARDLFVANNLVDALTDALTDTLGRLCEADGCGALLTNENAEDEDCVHHQLLTEAFARGATAGEMRTAPAEQPGP